VTRATAPRRLADHYRRLGNAFLFVVTESQMKIIHVVRQYWPSRGGLEEFVERLVLEQKACGADVCVITLDELFTNRGVKLPARETHNGVDIFRVPFCGSTRYPLAPGVLSYLSDADLVHVHAVDFFFDFLALSFGLSGGRVVAPPHGGFFHTITHSMLKRIWFKTMTRVSSRLYGAMAACSESDYRMFSSISPSNLRLVENGVDIDKFADRASAEPTKTIVTIGRLSNNKRIDRVLDVMTELVASDSEWRLHIVGTESDWSGEKLQREISARGLEPYVEVHLGPDNKGVAQVISQCSIFASASEYEGFGIALVEALSSGLLPVVNGNEAYLGFAAKHGGVRVVDYADPARGAAAIRAAFAELITSPRLRNEGIKIARRFTWSEVAQKYSAIYREVLGR